MNQCCLRHRSPLIQRWISISVVGYNAHSASSIFSSKISVGGYIANFESADSTLSETMLIPYQRLVLQCRIKISDVIYSTDSKLAPYRQRPMFLTTNISIVRQIADSEWALYITALVRHQRCRIQRWFWINGVSYNVLSRPMSYLTTVMNQHCKIQCHSNADTALIWNQWC